MAIALGWKPLDFTLELQYGGDYKTTLHSSEPWEAGTSIELWFYRTPDPRGDTEPFIWTATVAGANATWDVPATTVNAVLDANARYIRLRKVDSGTLIWMRGLVNAS